MGMNDCNLYGLHLSRAPFLCEYQDALRRIDADIVLLRIRSGSVRVAETLERLLAHRARYEATIRRIELHRQTQAAARARRSGQIANDAARRDLDL